LTRVKLSADTRGRAQGRITVKGTLDTTDLGGPSGLGTALQRGLIVGVAGGGLGQPETLVFPTCSSATRCTGAANETARFRPKSGNLLTVAVSAPKRTFPPPLSSAPVTVTLSFTNSDQPGTASTCTVRGRSSQTAVCR